jgi:hypothetical protein
MRHLTIIGLSLCSALALASSPTSGTIASDTRFTIAVIPDTQNYTDYTHQKAEGFPFDASDLFLEQMRYVAGRVESAGGDVAFVTALGDMWQHQTLPIDPGHEARGFRRVPSRFFDEILGPPTPKTRTIEMATVKRGYEMIAGKVPFSVVPGNHDFDALWIDAKHPPAPDRPEDASNFGVWHVGGLTNFQSIFSDQSDFFRDKPWYVASHDGGGDSAQVFTAGGYRFLHIGLQYDPPNASLTWAASVIDRFRGLPTIISTHNYLDPDGTRLAYPGGDSHAVDPDDNNPQMVWEKLIARHDQIFLVLCGHRTFQGRSVDRNGFGHEVHQVLSDYQNRRQTAKAAGIDKKDVMIGDGWLRLMTFDMTGATPTVRVRTYSPHYKKFSTELREYADWYKADERPTLTDAEFLLHDDFSLTLTDFRTRFGERGSR